MTTIHPLPEWRPISTAPRDGTEVDLKGESDLVLAMCWQLFRGGAGKGIWAMHGKTSGALLCTWSEEDPDGAPTHWRPRHVG